MKAMELPLTQLVRALVLSRIMEEPRASRDLLGQRMLLTLFFERLTSPSNLFLKYNRIRLESGLMQVFKRLV